MKTKLDLHPTQIDILMYLLFHKPSRFMEINEGNISTDSFNFHLKSLIDAGLIEKQDTLYVLTPAGKEFANRFDTDRFVLEKQAKLGVMLVCEKEEDGKKVYLIQQRLKHPYFGYHGFITGKIGWGETVLQTAARELMEEANLTGDMTFKGIKHKLDYNEKNELLEDKFFYVCKVTNVSGQLHETFSGGKNFWITKEDIQKLDTLFDGVEESLEIAEGAQLSFKEIKYIVKGY